MSNHDKESISPGGSTIYKHKAHERETEIAIGDGPLMDAVEQHIERYIGKIERVFHEIISDLIHVDVYIVAPTPTRNFYTLVTSGMAERPMTVPPNGEAFRYAELMLCLPPDWPLGKAVGEIVPKIQNEDGEEEADEAFYWPIRWLKQLARLPHEYDTYLGMGHTVPNGDPPEPFAPNTRLCGVVLNIPLTVADDAWSFTVAAQPGDETADAVEERQVNLWAVYAITQDEMDFKLRDGADALMDKLVENDVTELVNISRKSVIAGGAAAVKKRRGLFGLFRA